MRRCRCSGRTTSGWPRPACATGILLETDGSRHGLNTDVTGALMVLGDHDVGFERAVVLGGGATATSVLLALVERRHVRTPPWWCATRTAPPRRSRTRWRGIGRAPAVEVLALADVGDAVLAGDILVSTVPTSAQTPELLAAAAGLPLVFEVVYEPWPTPLAATAERAGRTVINGLDLLLRPGGQPGGGDDRSLRRTGGRDALVQRKTPRGLGGGVTDLLSAHRRPRPGIPGLASGVLVPRLIASDPRAGARGAGAWTRSHRRGRRGEPAKPAKPATKRTSGLYVAVAALPGARLEGRARGRGECGR